jgi:hypothetical protein
VTHGSTVAERQKRRRGTTSAWFTPDCRKLCAFFDTKLGQPGRFLSLSDGTGAVPGWRGGSVVCLNEGMKRRTRASGDHDQVEIDANLRLCVFCKSNAAEEIKSSRFCASE